MHICTTSKEYLFDCRWYQLVLGASLSVHEPAAEHGVSGTSGSAGALLGWQHPNAASATGTKWNMDQPLPTSELRSAR
eukprot:6658649-Prorocentrum_lima.AAC.1